MRYSELLAEEAISSISPQQAIDGRMFGPLYHGTRASLEDIIKSGFDVERSISAASNGYRLQPYRPLSIAAPMHHLGFGAYFTTVKAIAKKFAGNTTKGMRTFYLDSKRVETINFGSANTMMRWWQQNGYDMTAEATQRGDHHAWVEATRKLTKTLHSRCDAVHYLGKSMYRLLDGDQVCVFDPSLIRVVDPKLATGLEVGSRVTHNQSFPEKYRGSNHYYLDAIKPGDAGRLPVGWHGIFKHYDEAEEARRQAVNLGRYPMHVIPPANITGVIQSVRPTPQGGHYYDVKWPKGGVQHNYTADELQQK